MSGCLYVSKSTGMAAVTQYHYSTVFFYHIDGRNFILAYQ
ncbi:hypothetical protein FLA_1323 [Filimonas lacunae]|nr:hypothetical protein FLA_1323 [Filimonas lacunae]